MQRTQRKVNISLSKGMLIKQREALARKIGEMQRRSEPAA